ncbi:TPA: tyrosine-type recombinase/integrase [Citrobacter freundii]|uniref:tyrosine-type recombinase/integrase n=1 Tax=Gammaproteobacteria TaxID=1236 RepID=UPI000663252D|nr:MULTISPECIES: tyrosine-type recombinase/integrase [Enterobacteriaceae]MCG6813632.1 site-specific integrase [Pseudomonas aeruginosa]MDN4207922.1 tyrosine-type recombinase/integrase [Citrobacter freundii]MDN4223048.1 tyrosine-type recombinase/integrase [Citrobacter freundii]MDN4249026.1 tyrosine-type recombinase/integrase [Citrobacter freundii]MDN4254168.1 tyrosine-type recombinase/integrase [Citrobacter freundii]
MNSEHRTGLAPYPAAMLMPVTNLDWSRIFAMRQLAASTPDAPAYLLAPEVAVLFSYMHDLRERCYFETLWNTGARPNEALALTPQDFEFRTAMPHVSLRTLKQRHRGRGRPTKDALPVRKVALWDADYRARMQSLIATFGIRKGDLLWPGRLSVKTDGQDDAIIQKSVSPDTVSRWLSRAIDTAKSDNVTFTVNPIMPKTFRSSFAMHILFNRIHPKVLQSLMGHKSFKSTEVYTRLFLFDVAGQHDVSFGFDVDTAKRVLTDHEVAGLPRF